MIYERFFSFFTRLMGKERSPHILALSFSTGFYIAFSPFPGFHTGMTIALAWLFSLNIAVVFAVSCAINNPWTMMPVYCIDYFFGDFVCTHIFRANTLCWNPGWMWRLNEWIAATIGIKHISLWSFLFGGNILGIGGALMVYPIVRRIFGRLQQTAQG